MSSTCRRIAAGAGLAWLLAAEIQAGDAGWIEVRSAHFAVRSDAGEKQAARTARQFERLRTALRELWPWARTDLGAPITVYAARNEVSLRRLLPSFFEGSSRPAGVFLAGLGRSYLALRTDVPLPRGGQPSPFRVLYHEYLHLVLDLNFERLPAWLHEGLAEFFGAAVVDDEGIEIGWPVASHVFTLREQGLLPTGALLRAERSSSGDREGDRASIFYAQSWALVHYLFRDERRGRTGPLSAYLKLRLDGVDDAEAARRTLGDPDDLHGALRSHVRALRATRRRVAVRLEPADEPSPARELRPAEVLTARADLLLVAGRRDDARALYARGLEADPESAEAKEGLGIIAHYDGREEQAYRWLDQAVRGQEASAAACYLHAALLWKRADGRAALERAQQGLERALALDGRLEPARALLARVREDREGEARPGAACRRGVSEDCRRACEAGVGDACAREGRAWERGEGATADFARAVAAYARGCDAGHGWSCFRLGFLSEQEQGVARDPERAIALYTRACDGGFAPGCTGRGTLQLGRATSAEHEQAAAWLRRGCDGGDLRGCSVLAALYEAGRGVPRDPARARALHERACAGGFTPSCRR